jgi:hypothetical protein
MAAGRKTLEENGCLENVYSFTVPPNYLQFIELRQEEGKRGCAEFISRRLRMSLKNLATRSFYFFSGLRAK